MGFSDSFVMLMSVALTLIIYSQIYPLLLRPTLDDFKALLTADPNDWTPLEIILIDAIPFLLLLGIVMRGVGYVFPRPYDERYGKL